MKSTVCVLRRRDSILNQIGSSVFGHVRVQPIDFRHGCDDATLGVTERWKCVDDALRPLVGECGTPDSKPNYNVERTMTAPVAVIVAYDMKFYEQVPFMSCNSCVALSYRRSP
jgi:hypothetical protein